MRLGKIEFDDPNFKEYDTLKQIKRIQLEDVVEEVDDYIVKEKKRLSTLLIEHDIPADIAQAIAEEFFK